MSSTEIYNLISNDKLSDHKGNPITYESIYRWIDLFFVYHPVSPDEKFIPLMGFALRTIHKDGTLLKMSYDHDDFELPYTNDYYDPGYDATGVAAIMRTKVKAYVNNCCFNAVLEQWAEDEEYLPPPDIEDDEIMNSEDTGKDIEEDMSDDWGDVIPWF